MNGPGLKRARLDFGSDNDEPKPAKNKELKRSKIQILVGKKRSHFATAGALIASISMIAFSGSDKPAS